MKNGTKETGPKIGEKKIGRKMGQEQAEVSQDKLKQIS